MTDLYREFDLKTRRLLPVKEAYAGQVGDENSTTLHFKFNPTDFNADGEYIPYIVFNVYQEDGVPYTYSPTTDPAFNGTRFDIPWDVTVRSRGILQYQIKFLRYETTEDPGEQYVECIMSEIDKIVIRKSIMPVPPSTVSEVDPRLWAKIFQLFETAFVRVEADNTVNKTILTFYPTIDGGTPYVIEVPSIIVDGEIKNGQSIYWDSETESFKPYDTFQKNLFIGDITGNGVKTEWTVEHGLDGVPYGVTVDKVTKSGGSVISRRPIMVSTDFDDTNVYIYFTEPPVFGDEFEVYVSENNNEV